MVLSLVGIERDARPLLAALRDDIKSFKDKIILIISRRDDFNVDYDTSYIRHSSEYINKNIVVKLNGLKRLFLLCKEEKTVAKIDILIGFFNDIKEGFDEREPLLQKAWKRDSENWGIVKTQMIYYLIVLNKKLDRILRKGGVLDSMEAKFAKKKAA